MKQDWMMIFGDDPQDERPAARCDRCRGAVYARELVHVIDGFVICPECFFDFAFDYFSGCMTEGREIGGTGD